MAGKMRRSSIVAALMACGMLLGVVALPTSSGATTVDHGMEGLAGNLVKQVRTIDEGPVLSVGFLGHLGLTPFRAQDGPSTVLAFDPDSAHPRNPPGYFAYHTSTLRPTGFGRDCPPEPLLAHTASFGRTHCWETSFNSHDPGSGLMGAWLRPVGRDASTGAPVVLHDMGRAQGREATGLCGTGVVGLTAARTMGRISDLSMHHVHPTEVARDWAFDVGVEAREVSPRFWTNPSGRDFLSDHRYALTPWDATYAPATPDITAPFLTPSTPTDCARYPVGSELTVSYECRDIVADLTQPWSGNGASEPPAYSLVPAATCEGPVPNGQALDTSTPGEKTFTVTMTDEAGNTRTRTVVYYVTEPHTTAVVNAGGTKTGQVGEPIQLEAQVDDMDFAWRDNEWRFPAGAPCVFLPVWHSGSDSIVRGTQRATVRCNEPGTYTATYEVRDLSEDRRSLVFVRDTAQVVVVEPGGGQQFDFDGFYAPIDNAPTINTVAAGRAIPVKFSLGGDQGLDIFDEGYPRSRRAPCDNAAASSDVEQTVSPRTSELSYDPATGHYQYVWTTSKNWKADCRELVVRFVDGTEATALFRFR